MMALTRTDGTETIFILAHGTRDCMTDTDVAIVGSGPAGLSAALFIAKNGLDMTVFDTNDTAMHAARLYNYLGVENVMGDEFMDVAREQGAERYQGEAVTDIERTGESSQVTTDEDEYDVPYVVLASGYPRDLVKELGCELGRFDTVNINVNCKTSVGNAYAAGC
jgi:thioredoxin reductase (NADPH)